MRKEFGKSAPDGCKPELLFIEYVWNYGIEPYKLLGFLFLGMFEEMG